MLSIKEIHFYNILVEKGFASPMNCPFNDDSVGDHIIFPELDEKNNLFFNCLTCRTKFELGLNTEELIKKAIDKYKNIV